MRETRLACRLLSRITHQVSSNPFMKRQRFQPHNLVHDFPANESRCSGDQDFHFSAGNLASSSRTSFTSDPIVFRLTSNLQPAAANSSGNGREPPSARTRL